MALRCRGAAITDKVFSRFGEMLRREGLRHGFALHLVSEEGSVEVFEGFFNQMQAVSRRPAPSRLMCYHVAVAGPDEDAAWSTLDAETLHMKRLGTQYPSTCYLLSNLVAPMCLTS